MLLRQRNFCNDRQLSKQRSPRLNTLGDNQNCINFMLANLVEAVSYQVERGKRPKQLPAFVYNTSVPIMTQGVSS